MSFKADKMGLSAVTLPQHKKRYYFVLARDNTADAGVLFYSIGCCTVLIPALWEAVPASFDSHQSLEMTVIGHKKQKQSCNCL